MHFNNNDNDNLKTSPQGTQPTAIDIYDHTATKPINGNITNTNINNNNNYKKIASLTCPPTHDGHSSNGSCTSSTDSGVILMPDDDYTASHENETPIAKLNNGKCHNSERISMEPQNAMPAYTLDNIKNINKITVKMPPGGGGGGALQNDDASDKGKCDPDEDQLIANNNQKNSNSWPPPGKDPESAEVKVEDCRRSSASKHSSPAVSIRSTSISIVSINENAEDSSIVDSDSECEADAEGVHSKYIVKKLGQQATYAPNSAEVTNLHKGLTVVGQRVSPAVGEPPTTVAEQLLNGGALVTRANQGHFGPPAIPQGGVAGGSGTQISSIEVTNSGFTIGDKYIYQAPVTIQQIVIRDKDGGGHENPGFMSDSEKSNNGDGPGAKPFAPAGRDQAFRLVTTRKAVIATGIIVTLTIICGIVFATSSLYKSANRKSKLLGDGDDSRQNIPINSTIGRDNIGSGKVLRIVARDGWLAQPPNNKYLPLRLPVDQIILIATKTDLCVTQAACTYRVRYIQTYNIESLRLDDIMYNFLIGGDGNVYEGRGWDNVAAHLKGHNENSLSFAFIGTFNKQKPNDKQLLVTKLLLEEGIRRGKISPDYKIYGANTFDPTGLDTAADGLYDSFKDWPHWSAEANSVGATPA